MGSAILGATYGGTLGLFVGCITEGSSVEGTCVMPVVFASGGAIVGALECNQLIGRREIKGPKKENREQK